MRVARHFIVRIIFVFAVVIVIIFPPACIVDGSNRNVAVLVAIGKVLAVENTCVSFVQVCRVVVS